MKPIILIAAWQGYKKRGDQDACRDTYLKEWGHVIPHRFVYDREYTGHLKNDEIRVDAPTGFMECVFKTHKGITWALENGYDYVFSAPTDCYIIIPRLLASGYDSLDYTGFQADEGHIGGGSGYWLNRFAMQIVAASKPVLDYEDRWVGNVLRSAGIVPVHDPRYWDRGQPWQDGIITVHLSKATGVYDPLWMIDQHTTFMVEHEICRP
jgi:hypothetical protein